MEEDLKNLKWEYLSNHWMNVTKNEDDLSLKNTSYRRRTHKLKIGISQQPVGRSYSNLKHRLIGPNSNVMVIRNEDDIKV